MLNKRNATLAACSAAGVLVLGSILASTPTARQPTPPDAWEYKVVEISALRSLEARNSFEAISKLLSDPAACAGVEKNLHDRLNALGREGWEMIDTDRKGTYWFKRRTR